MGRAVIAVLNDTHTGSALAPFPGESWELEDGNVLLPNAWQRTLSAHWAECWDVVGQLRKGARLIVWHVGDPVEGIHHDMMQIHSNLAEEQERMHIALIRDGLKRAKWKPQVDKIVYFTDTPAHSGSGSASVERIVRKLTDSDDTDGRVAVPYLLGRVNGTLFDVAHEGFTEGGREWTRDNTMRAYLQSRYITTLKHKVAMPRYILRAHRHRFRVADIRDDNGRIISEAIMLPAWKIKDDFVYRRWPEAISNVGMVVFEVASDGDTRWRALTLEMRQDEEVEL